MHGFVRARRHDVFLNEKLDPVSNRLEKAEWSDAVRTVPVLDSPKNFSFQDRDQRKQRHENAENTRDVDEARNNCLHPLRRGRNKGEQPALQRNKNLIDGVAAHSSRRKAMADYLGKAESLRNLS